MNIDNDIAALMHDIHIKDQFIEHLEQRIAELEAERAWKPIDTAPKDGTKIIILSTEDLVYVAKIDIEYSGPEDPVKRIAWKSSCGMYNIFAKGWKPIPDPPEETL